MNLFGFDSNFDFDLGSRLFPVQPPLSGPPPAFSREFFPAVRILVVALHDAIQFFLQFLLLHDPVRVVMEISGMLRCNGEINSRLAEPVELQLLNALVLPVDLPQAQAQ